MRRWFLQKGRDMYLFVSGSQEMKKFRKYQTTSDYLVAKTESGIRKKVLAYYRKYPGHPKDEPFGKLLFQKKYGAVVLDDGNVIGWIVKVDGVVE